MQTDEVVLVPHLTYDPNNDNIHGYHDDDKKRDSI